MFSPQVVLSLNVFGGGKSRCFHFCDRRLTPEMEKRKRHSYPVCRESWCHETSIHSFITLRNCMIFRRCGKTTKRRGQCSGTLLHFVSHQVQAQPTLRNVGVNQTAQNVLCHALEVFVRLQSPCRNTTLSLRAICSAGEPVLFER